MSSRNEIKDHAPGAYYHIYNRGVERHRIFFDHHDYQRFKEQIAKALEREPSIELLAYCLMPNHFHLQLRQYDSFGMSRFMRRLSTAYVMYLNKRRTRVGPLFQGIYKAVHLVGPEALMANSRYIHLNPAKAGLDWRQHQHSSINAYLVPFPTDPLVNPYPVLELFDFPDDYSRYLSRSKLRP
jgi:REP element-mobilizing transposase RayT